MHSRAVRNGYREQGLQRWPLGTARTTRFKMQGYWRLRHRPCGFRLID